MKRTCALLSLASLCCLAAPALAQDADSIVGTWLNGEGTAHVEIQNEGGKYFGKIVWLKEPVYPADDPKGMAGKTKVDRENPDPARRNDPILGLRMLRDFRFDSPGHWKDGRIYDPKNGKDYKCKIAMETPDVLKVRGFIGISLIGRTDTWTRVR
ncbi:MAG TPA: DUF2147 domain-containing protein [Vicinamibacterales bacterium]|nr:DUF2147 domain-containing protein [Vicinamibacterales bacterium]HOG28253.1 DUF2147 domain-containing protein [Vicinamibacterales bacterium]HOQ59789.1 DUF2147 domain-containing protein [Vicinamibacterales bacterium]HPK71310.1 DUF2147 domain-containing protein [Vicinamibacterales bacterium]HPW19799.1 DUF2147 domain-containing protein [Vicinamibacterales bacterium]